MKIKTIENFYFGASKEMIERARVLRKNMTLAEKKVWKKLRNKQFQNIKFRRQHPINRFIVDFYCHEYKLVIEIDGGIHLTSEQKERDENRTFELENLGLKVIRFDNDTIIHDYQKFESVLNKIIFHTFD